MLWVFYVSLRTGSLAWGVPVKAVYQKQGPEKLTSLSWDEINSLRITKKRLKRTQFWQLISENIFVEWHLLFVHCKGWMVKHIEEEETSRHEKKKKHHLAQMAQPLDLPMKCKRASLYPIACHFSGIAGSLARVAARALPSQIRTIAMKTTRTGGLLVGGPETLSALT